MVGIDQTSFEGCSLRATLAISTLLQPPIARTGLVPHASVTTSGFKAPTPRDIPPVALTNIPHIESKSFQPYLSQIGSLYEAFQRAKEEGDGDSQLFRREKREARGEDWDSILGGKLQGSSRSGSMSPPISPSAQPSQTKRRASGQRRPHTVTPLSTIPPVYMEEDFHLENPRTFDIVSERSEIVRDPNRKADEAPSGRKALATNAILQEKLSWYLDTVEIHLISSISTASKSFFSALGSLRDLHAEAADSVQRIQRLRKDLAKIDKEMAMGGLKVVHLKRRRENVRKLGEAVRQLKDIVALVTHCEEMADQDEFEGALDGLDDVESLMAGVEPRRSRRDLNVPLAGIRDLRGLVALQGVADALRQLRSRVGKGYEARFLGTLHSDIRRHVDHAPVDMTFQRWSSTFARLRPGERRKPSAFPSYMSIDPSFRKELEGELKGLSRAKHTMAAATAFKSLVLREMKNIVRKHLPSSGEDDTESVMSASTMGGRQRTQQEKSTALARNLRALDPDDAYAMLAKIYTGISEGLRRLSVQVKILLDLTSTLEPVSRDPRSRPKSPAKVGSDQISSPSSGRRRATSAAQADLQQVLDLSSLLGDAVDIVQAQITKIVRVRSEQTGQLILSDFLRFFNLNRLFADECEAISGSSGISLKTVVDNQIKDFVAQFVNTQRHDIIDVMDSDKWDAKDFGEVENALLKVILDGSTSDAPSWRLEDNIGPATSNGTLTNGTSDGRDRIRPASIDEQRFILPSSALALLRSIEAFLHLTAAIPGMSSEIANGLLECLKLFNSRSSQLILGAGATRSAGLKNITTKHLALSSQSLSFGIGIMPYVRDFFRRHLGSSPNAGQIMLEFDKVKRFYQEHQNSIHEKLVEIMTSRATLHINTMKKTDWERAAGDPKGAVSPYIETLTKETATLQKVLSKHLPEQMMEVIMQPVFGNYRELLSQAFADISVRSMAAKER